MVLRLSEMNCLGKCQHTLADVGGGINRIFGESAASGKTLKSSIIQWLGGFTARGGRGFLSGTRLRAQRGEEFFVRQSVDDVARFEPAAPRRLDPVFHDLKLRRRMR